MRQLYPHNCKEKQLPSGKVDVWTSWTQSEDHKMDGLAFESFLRDYLESDKRGFEEKKGKETRVHALKPTHKAQRKLACRKPQERRLWGQKSEFMVILDEAWVHATT